MKNKSAHQVRKVGHKTISAVDWRASWLNFRYQNPGTGRPAARGLACVRGVARSINAPRLLVVLLTNSAYELINHYVEDRIAQTFIVMIHAVLLGVLSSCSSLNATHSVLRVSVAVM